MWGVAVLGFLKALPGLVGSLRDLIDTLKQMQNNQTDARINKIQEEVSTILAKVRHEEDRQKLLELVRALNDARSK